MKVEFPIVVLLLAMGCLLWNLRPSDAGRPHVEVVGSDVDASRPETKLTAQRNENASRLKEKAGAQELLLNSASNLTMSGPIEAAARLSVNLFEQQIVSDGRYFQMGQGRGRARLEFVYQDQENTKTIQQICDGQFYYRLESNGKSASLEFADLSKVAESDGNVLLADSKTWMASGGLSSLLEHLANQFNFETVQESKIGDIPVFLLRGRWNEDRLRRLLFGQINQNYIRNKIRWDKLPAHLPHSIEIALGNDEFLPLFPYRISFFQQQEKDGQVRPVEIVTMNLHAVTRHDQMAKELFRVDSGGPMKLYDITHDVVERILDLNQAYRSAELELQPTQRR